MYINETIGNKIVSLLKERGLKWNDYRDWLIDNKIIDMPTGKKEEVEKKLKTITVSLKNSFYNFKNGKTLYNIKDIILLSLFLEFDLLDLFKRYSLKDIEEYSNNKKSMRVSC